MASSSKKTASTSAPQTPQRSKKRKKTLDQEDPDIAPACPVRRKTKMLNKKEYSTITDRLGKFSLLNSVEHSPVLKTFPIFEELVSQDKVFTSLVSFHKETFISLYQDNAKGRDKYLSFQLEWHHHCCIFLLPSNLPIQCVISPPTCAMEDTRNLWLEFCCKLQGQQSAAASHGSATYSINREFMIAFSSVVYNILLHETTEQIAHVNPATSITTSTASVPHDQDDVYFRFGGGALASMLHRRYKEIKQCHDGRRDLVSMEITIIQAVNTKDKSLMPAYLKYRDNGNMYSPHVSFIPFLRSVDVCIREVVNDKGMELHGDQLIKVAHSLASQSTQLKTCFVEALQKRMVIETDIEEKAMDNVYTDLLQKLTNTRIQEFVSSLKQKIALQKGQTSTGGQNLRDQLLTHHTNSHMHTNLV